MQKKFDQAIALYTDALESNEEILDEIHYNLGLAYQGMENFPVAIEHYKKAINHNISHEGALYELAFCMDLIGELENSLSYYKKFIDEDPYSAAAWYNLGIVYNKLEKFEEAIEAYGYALAIDEEFASAHFNLGNACMSAGKYKEARAAGNKAIPLLTGYSMSIFKYDAAMIKKELAEIPNA